MDLRSLIGHQASVSAEMTVENVQALFKQLGVDFLAVLDGHNLIGVCARRELTQALGSRFGFSLNARQPIRAYLMGAAVRVTTTTEITEVFKIAAARNEREFYDDVLLVEETGGYAGMIPMRTVVRLQTDFLLGNIVNLETSRQEIAARNREMEKDLLMARELQTALLPSARTVPKANGPALDIVHRFHPAGGVSGDFFHIIELGNQSAGILVCDVMGHGVRSALITAMIGAFLEELKPMAGNPAQFLTRLNRDLTGILRQTGSLIFVTAAYVAIDVPLRQLRYAQAGHPSPLLTNGALGATRPMMCSEEAAGPALGLMEDFEYIATETAINPGDRVLIYTDGVTEAPARNGEEFGVERLTSHLDQNKFQTLKTVLDTLVKEITSFAGTILPDDVCIVGIEFTLS